jgi:hypothetical protein
MKVKELVRVEVSDTKLSQAEMRDLRRPEPGFYIESVARRMGDLRKPKTTESTAKGLDSL